MIRIFFLTFFTGVFLCNSIKPVLSYSPVVVFSGYFNGEYQSLTGNLIWQNRCGLAGDTLRLFFYSDFFSEVDRIRNGDLLRVEIYRSKDQVLGTSNILVHIARYYEQNSSYTITPKTIHTGKNKILFRVMNLDFQSGAKIVIDKINLFSPTVAGTYGEYLEISDGKIEGIVE